MCSMALRRVTTQGPPTKAEGENVNCYLEPKIAIFMQVTT
jgi:hypothetical protein